MNRTNSTVPLVLWTALALTVPCAVTGAETAYREHRAHEHGHGVLEVVAEGDVMAIALRIPAVNAVGFEHAPSTEQQHRLVEEMIARLRRGERLFVASRAAACRLVKADVELAGMEGEHREDHDDDDHAKGEHQEDGHSSHDHDEHEKDADSSHEHAEESHSELHAEYEFRCAEPARLEAIQVRVFDALSDVEAIDAHVVTETFQGAAQLTAGNATVKLAR